MSDTTDGQLARRPTLRRASTLIVVRDVEHGMQVLLLRRVEHKSDPNSRAYVFPGGVVDPVDKASYTHCSGLDDAAASERLGLPAGALDFYIAAIRECFEEAGLLFAYERSLCLTTLLEMPAEILANLRTSVHDGAIGLDKVCRRFGLRLAVDRLAYHSHWRRRRASKSASIHASSSRWLPLASRHRSIAMKRSNIFGYAPRKHSRRLT
jgi:8-oxo-dGTP pyrophosphatase MutT (NUDIX family)